MIDAAQNLKAAPYVAAVRDLVMPCVCAAARALIAAVASDVISRATYFTHPPGKSMTKHQKVTDTIADMGYKTLDDGVDPHGRRATG